MREEVDYQQRLYNAAEAFFYAGILTSLSFDASNNLLVFVLGGGKSRGHDLYKLFEELEDFAPTAAEALIQITLTPEAAERTLLKPYRPRQKYSRSGAMRMKKSFFVLPPIRS